MALISSLEKIRDLYSSNVAKSGAISTSVGWNTPESQELRFEKLTQVIDRRDQAVSVNDYGCGYGAHLDYLTTKGIKVSSYHGYDLSNEMLQAAREGHASFAGRLDLHESSTLTTEADYTFVSGTFNVRFGSSEDEWRGFVETRLDEINHNSKLGFAFNLLSTYVDWKEDHLYYGNPLYWFDHCKRRFSRKVSLLHDYPLYEWTILVRK